MTDHEAALPGGMRRRAALAPPAEAAAFIKGADISWMPQMEAHGYYWNNRSGARLREAMYRYVNDSLNVIKNRGVTPAWVKIGTWPSRRSWTASRTSSMPTGATVDAGTPPGSRRTHKAATYPQCWPTCVPSSPATASR